MKTHGSGNRPLVNDTKDLASIAKYISSGKCKNVFLMLGAGVSTSAGIPDFRSPGTGLYANLARLNLPYPEAVFEINFFRRNPVPFYTLAQELYPGRFRPTLTHSFIKLLCTHSLLHTCFTQNIDTLERRAGVPENKIVEAHGSFATQRCINCQLAYDDEQMKKDVQNKRIPHCDVCGGLVKPDIVFFGEALPLAFHLSINNLKKADLLIIIGTSLTVHPFASLVGLVPESCPRLLINIDHVGDIGSRRRDVVCLGKCDVIIRQLCQYLGWEAELDKAWELTKDSLEGEQGKIDREDEGGDRKEVVDDDDTRVEDLKEEVDKLTEEIAKVLELNADVLADSQPETTGTSDGKGQQNPSADTNDRSQPPEPEARDPGEEKVNIPPLEDSLKEDDGVGNLDHDTVTRGPDGKL